MTDARGTKDFLKLMANNRAKLLATLGGGILIFIIWQFSLVLAARYIGPVTQFLVSQAGELHPHDEALGAFLLMVLGFGPPFLILLAWRKIMERRSACTLVTANPRIRWKIIISAMIFVGGLGLACAFVFDPTGAGDIAARVLRFSPLDWALLACAYGGGVAVQAGFEEVFVRGWLQQHLARFLRHTPTVILVSASVFSLIHLGSPGLATHIVAFVSGLAYGWSVVRLNGLEAAIGAHIGNNLVAALFAGAMMSGNQADLSLTDFWLYGAYLLGFLGFVEFCARFFPAPSPDAVSRTP